MLTHILSLLIIFPFNSCHEYNLIPTLDELNEIRNAPFVPIESLFRERRDTASTSVFIYKCKSAPSSALVLAGNDNILLTKCLFYTDYPIFFMNISAYAVIIYRSELKRIDIDIFIFNTNLFKGTMLLVEQTSCQRIPWTVFEICFKTRIFDEKGNLLMCGVVELKWKFVTVVGQVSLKCLSMKNESLEIVPYPETLVGIVNTLINSSSQVYNILGTTLKQLQDVSSSTKLLLDAELSKVDENKIFEQLTNDNIEKILNSTITETASTQLV